MTDQNVLDGIVTCHCLMSKNFIMFHVHDPKLAIEEAYLKCDKIKNKTHWKMLGRSLK